MDYKVINVYIHSMALGKLNFYSILANNLYGNTVNMDRKTEFWPLRKNKSSGKIENASINMFALILFI